MCRSARFFVAFAAIMGSLALPAVSSAIVLGQVDDFSVPGDGTMSWSGGSAPTRIPNGGPNGAGDAYLRINAFNGNLGARNMDQWTGDYLSEGVLDIEFDLSNLGASPLELRLTVFSGFGQAFTSASAFLLPVAPGWVSHTFSLRPSDLVHIDGFGPDDWNLAMANVNNLLIRHQPGSGGGPGSPGQQFPVTGTLGMDNITALPEPATLGLLSIGFLMIRRRSRS